MYPCTVLNIIRGKEVVVDQAAVPGQSPLEEVGLWVEGVQESLDIKQQSLETSYPENMTAGGFHQMAALWSLGSSW